MIPKARVKQIGLKRINKRLYKVAGYSGKLGFAPEHKRRLYKTFDRAVRYSIELRDYYQAPVVEY